MWEMSIKVVELMHWRSSHIRTVFIIVRILWVRSIHDDHICGEYNGFPLTLCVYVDHSKRELVGTKLRPPPPPLPYVTLSTPPGLEAIQTRGSSSLMFDSRGKVKGRRRRWLYENVGNLHFYESPLLLGYIYIYIYVYVYLAWIGNRRLREANVYYREKMTPRERRLSFYETRFERFSLRHTFTANRRTRGDASGLFLSSDSGYVFSNFWFFFVVLGVLRFFMRKGWLNFFFYDFRNRSKFFFTDLFWVVSHFLRFLGFFRFHMFLDRRFPDFWSFMIAFFQFWVFLPIRFKIFHIFKILKIFFRF